MRRHGAEQLAVMRPTAPCDKFSVYGAGAKEGIQAHDRFNLVKVSLKLEHD
jgi:hypothetical protein